MAQKEPQVAPEKEDCDAARPSAANSAERPPRPTRPRLRADLLVTDARGAFRGRGFEGFYADNTRILSVQELLAGEQRMNAFVASPTGPRSHLAYSQVPAVDGVPPSSVFVQMDYLLSDRLRTQLRVWSYTRQPIRFELALRLAADFVDTSELK
ncbi:MAG: hypothetical protein M3133_05920, partial [Actinomycetota bacterium]|nr:hypothetical protein [Actinomycetota bacterium]